MRHSPALGQARVMQLTTAALGDAHQAPREFELVTFRLGAERDTNYATEPLLIMNITLHVHI